MSIFHTPTPIYKTAPVPSGAREQPRESRNLCDWIALRFRTPTPVYASRPPEPGPVIGPAPEPPGLPGPVPARQGDACPRRRRRRRNRR